MLISSFELESLAAARQEAPQIPRGFLTLKWRPDWMANMRELQCTTFHVLDRRLTGARVHAIREAGYRPLAYTVNDPARARELLSWGVESIITDYPDRILAGIR